jgi:hypothetical protein
MTQQKLAALRRLIDRHTRENTISKEVARESLVREGIYTASGEIAPDYQPERPAPRRAAEPTGA